MTTPRTASNARLQRWLEQQRWHAAPADGATVTVIDVETAAIDDTVSIGIVLTDDREQYQLIRSDSAPDRATHPKTAEALARFVACGATVPTADGAEIRAHWIDDAPLGTAGARPLGADQSNTSIAVGGTHVMKVLRRLQVGLHPEVEIGEHLARVESQGTLHVPAPSLAGWYELVEPEGTSTVLGLVHRLVSGGADGWALVLSGLAADPNEVLARIRSLGVAVAELHVALAQPGPGGFGTDPLDARSIWAIADATLNDPWLPPHGHPAVARAVERIGEDAGAAIRTHGDLHLGQTLYGADGWNIIDFEGEPTRPLHHRRIHQSPLRDVAGMLRSLSYAVAAHERSGATPLRPGWIAGARAALLDGYLAAVEPSLLPRTAPATHALLTLFEIEKALYELAYEQAHRPDWVAIPRDGLLALVEQARP